MSKLPAKLAALALLSVALSACAPLTAEAPLFTTADQIGPAPFTEGVWVGIDDKCPRAAVLRHGRLPRGCEPLQLHRLPDGAWQFSGGGADQNGERRDLSLRMIVAPTSEHPADAAYSPLYVAEYVDSNQGATPRYAAVAPIGALPAREIYVVAEIDCTAILREGPIEGVTERHDEHGQLSGCVAASQAAVREAARRAAIEGLASNDDSRMVFVRP